MVHLCVLVQGAAPPPSQRAGGGAARSAMRPALLAAVLVGSLIVVVAIALVLVFVLISINVLRLILVISNGTSTNTRDVIPLLGLKNMDININPKTRISNTTFMIIRINMCTAIATSMQRLPSRRLRRGAQRASSAQCRAAAGAWRRGTHSTPSARGAC